MTLYAYRKYNSKGYIEYLEEPEQPYEIIDIIDNSLEIENIEKAHKLSLEAGELLKKSDITIIRCLERDIEIPQEWIFYRDNLRKIKNGSGENIPEIPKYPE